MDAEEKGALIGTMQEGRTREEPVAEEKEARAGTAGIETGGDNLRDSPCDRRVCTPQELLETLRPNLNLKNGKLREARVRPGRSRVLWLQLSETVTTGGTAPAKYPETRLTEEQWSPGSFRNLVTAVLCTPGVPRYTLVMEKKWAAVLLENKDWNQYAINEGKTYQRPRGDLVGHRRFSGGWLIYPEPVGNVRRTRAEDASITPAPSLDLWSGTSCWTVAQG